MRSAIAVKYTRKGALGECGSEEATVDGEQDPRVRQWRRERMREGTESGTQEAVG